MMMKHAAGTTKLSREAARLVRLATAITESGSQIERDAWQQQAMTLITGLFQKKMNETLEQALDALWVDNPAACDVLALMIESHAETLTESKDHNAVLLVVPILAWSRYTIPSGRIKPQRLGELRGHLRQQILASDVKLALCDVMYSPDQLPRGFIETRALLQQLATAAQTEDDLQVDVSTLAQAGEYVADVRYIFAAALVNKGAPIFRWQQTDITANEVLQAWELHTRTWFSQLLPGCHVSPLLPNAFFSAWRKLEQEARPFSLRAAISYLCETLTISPAELRAVVAPCYDQALEEYRIGFSLLNKQNILHGVVWPLVDNEQEDTDILTQIEQELVGLGKVTVLSNSLPLEYCDDCGTPLFPNAEGELQHPELPEGDAAVPHLH
ncbi:MAG: DUF2863 family protein [Betaproteobacteria bacterium]|nr:DUF2863 family protein [Betaproteobacteria bacterium]